MDSFRPPSRLKNDFNISIKSELMTGLKKDDLASAGNSRGSSVNSSTNMSKKFNLSCSNNKYPRRRPLNPKTDCYYEEELYVKGCTAVWSKGKALNLFYCDKKNHGAMGHFYCKHSGSKINIIFSDIYPMKLYIFPPKCIQ